MNNNSRTKNSIRNLTTSFGSQLLLILIKFVCRTVFIRTLGKTYLGVNGLFSDILTMLSLTELGLDTAINFKLYKPLADKDIHRIQLLMKFYKYAYLIVGMVILILGLCLIPFLPYLIKDYDTLAPLNINPVLIYGIYLAQSVTSYWFFASRSAIVKADQREYIINITTFITTLLMNICQIIELIIWRDFIIYTVLMVAFSIINNVVNAIITTRVYPEVFKVTRDSLSKNEIKDIFKDLGALFVSKANNVVLKATDNLVLSTFIGLAIVGTYSNYLMIYTTIRSVLAKVYNAAKASMGNLFATSDAQKKNSFFELMNFITMMLYGTAAVGVAVEVDEMMQCWVGNEYVIAQPFSMLMGIEILFMGIKINLNQIRNVAGLFRQMWFRPLLGIIINLGVSIVMVQFCGIYGVIIGTIASDILTNFLVDPPIINKFALNSVKPISAYYIRNLGYILVLSSVCSVDLLLCRNVLIGYGWISVIVHSAICAISVPAVFMILYRNSNNAQYVVNTGKQVLKRIKLKCVR